MTTAALPTLELRDLYAGYDGGWALRDVNLELPPGMLNRVIDQVTFVANKWTTAPGNYEKFNSGSFTIDRNGPLVINAGQEAGV